ncbi:hypothetical protein WJX72_009958 [[Myrmecia] bisecta]|uniref:Rit1 N-terminal domain-containing protein n=1 Tax=[Myrmecia] bisecta TaxID=41462 RepID=A0AAW1QBX2_9CHLO
MACGLCCCLIAGLYPSFPVFANLRCGLWYIKSPDNTCYFKSTDGHNGNWSFSTTRLNLQVAEAAAKCGGCVIVDATRRGKTFPDALTKTIPIWAAVLNQAQLQEVGADLTQLAAQLRKPLQPLWVSQQTRIWLNKVPDPGALDFTPLVLVSASLPHARQRRITGAMADEQGERWAYEYVPGAGDDEESWAKGLTPALLWAHQQELVLAGPRGVEELVQRLVQANRAVGGSRQVPSPGPDEASPRPRESHNLLPAGCAPLAAGTVRCSASGLYWIGDLGIALADCAAGDALQVWDEVDAVLDCGGVEHAGMKSEATTQMKRTLLEAAESPSPSALRRRERPGRLPRAGIPAGMLQPA